MWESTSFGFRTRCKAKKYVEKAGGRSNLADAQTNFVDGKHLAIHVDGIGLENRTGRHLEALGMATGDTGQIVKWADECVNNSDMEIEEFNTAK